MTRNMELPDNLVDQIHYDISHGRLEGNEIFLTAEQMADCPECMGSIKDGHMLLGKVIRLTEGEPSVVYPPKTPNEPWTVGGSWMRGSGKISIIE